jgi:hypothetical protein
MNSAQRFAYLASYLPIHHYLEIGVSAGATFKNVSFPHKVAVDPKFRFKYKSSKAEEYHEVTSDAYFTRLDRAAKFDLIFIDGLHHAEQALQDLRHAVDHSHERTLIVLDDVYPCDRFSVMRSQEKAVTLRMLHRKDSPAPRAWHGDVFKTAFYVAVHWHHLSFVTIDQGFGNPQMLLWPEWRETLPAPDFGKDLFSLTYDDFVKHQALLNLKPETVALDTAIAGAQRGK